ncbi:hypothetical protein HYZ78_01220 [Candidatus Microgenomates bacterium]|nr:hypothetical protein [Candidatus Microgenomates bacterium]
MQNTKQIGDTAVALVLSRLLRKEYAVLIPFGDSQRYDLVLDKENKLFRIQCKSGRVRNGCIRFNSSSTEWYKKHRRKGYKGQVDFFGVYCPELDKTYLVPVDDVGETQGVLRIEKPKNNQGKYIRWSNEYEI